MIGLFVSPGLNEMKFPTFSHSVKAQEYDVVKPSIDVLKRMYTEPEEDTKKPKTEVCLIKGKFFPFHNGHNTIIDDACAESGSKVFLVIVSPRTSSLGVTKELHKDMMDQVVANNKNVCGYEFTDGKSWLETISVLPKAVTAKSFSGSIEECEDITLMAGSGIATIPATRHISSKTIIQKIKDEDQDGYKKLVPKYLHNYFYKIKSELR